MSGAETKKFKGVNEHIFKASIVNGDAGPLFAHLEQLGFEAHRAQEVIGLIRRTSALVLPRAEAAADERRDTFLKGVRERIEAIFASALTSFDSAETLIRRAEGGYRRILAARSRLPIAQRPGEVIAAGLLICVQRQMIEIGNAIKAALHRDGVVAQGPVNIGEPDGPPIDPDAAIEMVVRALAGALTVEAYAQGWFDDSGSLRLPALPEVDEEAIGDAQQDLALGRIWSRWRRQEETARFHDGSIEAVEPAKIEANLPAEITCALCTGSVEDAYDYAANLRRGTQVSGNAYEIIQMLRDDTRVLGIDVAVPLPPIAFVSDAEAVQSLALSERLGYEVLSDTEEPGGLPLALWVRGYSALGVWAEQRVSAGSLLRTTDAELVALLQRVSLSESQARLLLTSLTFGRQSRDLYDTPLIRLGENEWIVVAPAVAHAHLAIVIPSMLAQRRIQLRRKGHAFNDRVVNLFKAHQLDARAIERKRGGETYDYDVLVPWGDFLFLFECKNHGLSGNDPIQAYHFKQELRSTIGQVQRLLGALEAHPDILTNEWGAEILSKQIVPCILHNEPYARDGQIDGIHVYDYSALSRFFKSGAFHIGHDHRVGDRTVRVEAETRRIWAGNAPVAEDLIAQLRSPAQLEMLWPEVQCASVVYQLDSTTIAVHELLTRKPLTEDERIAATGADVEAVKAKLAEGDAAIDAWKTRLHAP